MLCSQETHQGILTGKFSFGSQLFLDKSKVVLEIVGSDPLLPILIKNR